MSEKINVSETRDRRTEVMTRFLESASNISAFKGKRAETVLGTEDNRRAFLEQISEKDFLELLNGTNGIFRDKKKEDWNMDGQGVVLNSIGGDRHIPPRYEDKLDLLREIFRNVKTMIRNGRTFEDIALLVSSSINEIHPYLDGNGRTSRFVYILLAQGYTKEAKLVLKDILGEDGSETIDINPRVLYPYIEHIILEEIGLRDKNLNSENIVGWFSDIRPIRNVPFQKEIVPDKKDEFINALNDDYMTMLFALFLYIRDLHRHERYIKKFPSRTVIMVDRLIPDLGVVNLEQIMENYWHIKKRDAEVPMDSITNPEKPEYIIEKEGKEKITILNLFKGELMSRI